MLPLQHGLTKGAWPARQTDQTDDPLDIGHEFQITGSTISSNESRGRGTSWEFASFQLQMYLARNSNLYLDLLLLPRLRAECNIGEEGKYNWDLTGRRTHFKDSRVDAPTNKAKLQFEISG